MTRTIQFEAVIQLTTKDDEFDVARELAAATSAWALVSGRKMITYSFNGPIDYPTLDDSKRVDTEVKGSTYELLMIFPHHPNTLFPTNQKPLTFVTLEYARNWAKDILNKALDSTAVKTLKEAWKTEEVPEPSFIIIQRDGVGVEFLPSVMRYKKVDRNS